MNLSRYLYTGPPSGVTLRLNEHRETLDVQLHPGQSVELPAAHDYTRVLLALNHLQPLPTPSRPAGKTPKPLSLAKD
ncbi:hypothetical protein F8N49_22055 [Pseudomonas sp. GXM4]|uniref:hypothetical protein n=1 Tax=Pseudomonas TaxID=286 RepID=UPI000F045388|nr:MULTISPECIES: hypothetical protein [Pseudomonas]KAB2518463.1 hypothetical protein F8N49_22055 [Pseudomonas sp. GXM4]